MIDIGPTKIYQACLFVDEYGGTPSEEMGSATHAYEHLEPTLLQFIARFDFERNVRPFQLSYRHFNLYLCDTGGWEDSQKVVEFMRALGRVVRGRSSRAFLFWTGETWEQFCTVNPDLEDYTACINACGINWMDQVVNHLENQSKDT